MTGRAQRSSKLRDEERATDTPILYLVRWAVLIFSVNWRRQEESTKSWEPWWSSRGLCRPSLETPPSWDCNSKASKAECTYIWTDREGESPEYLFLWEHFLCAWLVESKSRNHSMKWMISQPITSWLKALDVATAFQKQVDDAWARPPAWTFVGVDALRVTIYLYCLPETRMTCQLGTSYFTWIWLNLFNFISWQDRQHHVPHSAHGQKLAARDICRMTLQMWLQQNVSIVRLWGCTPPRLDLEISQPVKCRQWWACEGP